MASVTTKKELLHLCKTACDELSIFIKVLYNNLSGDSSKLKEDKSIFSIADGVVQQSLKSFLFTPDRFEAVVGEEDESNINISSAPYNVDDLIVPEQYNEIISSLCVRLNALGQAIDKDAYKNLTVFIDPIDGTREFVTKLGEQSSICIGFAEDGVPVAGLVYRPIPEPPTWAAGCKSEGESFGNLDLQVPPNSKGFLTTNGSISPFLASLIKELDFERVKSGGAGNKMMMVLEGKGQCYIQDRGVSRWDTCAAQAVLEAQGGVLAKLSPFVENMKLESYTYRKSTTNLDFVPGQANLTPYNSPLGKNAKGPADDISKVKPYSNLCGLIAIDKAGLSEVKKYHDAIQRARKESDLAYD